MRMRDHRLPFFSIIDIILMAPILIFAIWVYLLPPLQTFGYHPLFSDDAIFAIMARKALEEGPAGAFHLSWGPLLSWLIALLYKFFSIPLEDGGRVVTGAVLFLRIIPAYFLTKQLLNRTAALIAIMFIALYPMILVPQETALAEGLYSFIILTGLLFSYLALKTEELKWYFMAGLCWGLGFLARLEGWLFLIPLILLAGLKIIYDYKNNNKLLIIRLFTVSVLTTVLISLPYLIFVRQVFGSWTLNPRLNIIMTAPVSSYVPYEDYNGLTTLAQVYFSGDHESYKSNLWHPTSFLFWRSLGRHWSTLSITPIRYLNFFKESIPLLSLFGALGISLTVLTIFKNKFQLVLTIFSFFALSFSLLDFSLVTLEFLSPMIFNPNGTLILIMDQFWRMLNTEGYFSGLARDIIIIIITLFFLIKKREYIALFIHHCYLHRLKIYLPLSLFFGFIPLLFHSFASKYTVWLGPVLSIFAGIFIASISSWIYITISKNYSTFHPQKLKKLIQTATIIIFLLINWPLFYGTINNRYGQYNQNNFLISLREKPGLEILKDHGPGAKIATFYEAPTYYAQGNLFYFMTDSNVSLEETLSYLEKNQVDYLVADKDQAYLTHKNLRPLMSRQTKLNNWQMIYSDPPPTKEVVANNLTTNMLVTVWKRVN